MRNRLLCVMVFAVIVTLAVQLPAQVQTDVPAVIPGAKAVNVEHIKVHGKSLEGNLEGDAVDRDLFVFFLPGYAKDKIAAIRLYMHSRLFDRRGTMVP